MRKTTTKLEKFSYGMGDVGCNFIWSFASAFISFYYTDSVGVSIAFVGTMMLLARVFDGFSDIGMGIIIDKTNTKYGKARPWLLFACIPFAISLILVFNVPASFSDFAKGIYIYITYFFMAVICYTIVNLAYHAMLPRITVEPKDRITITVVRSMMVMVAIMVINSITNPLLEVLGGNTNQSAWSKLVFIYAIIALACLLLTFFIVKEKVGNTENSEGKKHSDVSIKSALKVILKCRYFYIAAFVFFLQYFSSGVTSGVGIYFFKDVIGNTNLFGIISIIGVIPMVTLMPFMPRVFAKFGKRNTMVCGLVIICVSSVLQYIGLMAEEININLYFATTALKAIGGVPIQAAIFTLAADVVDYTSWKDGVRVEGITTSINSFGMKVGTGLGAAAMGWILQFGKYDGKLAVQPDSAIAAMKFISVGIPLIVSLLFIFMLLFWDIEKHQKDITKSLEQQNYLEV